MITSHIASKLQNQINQQLNHKVSFFRLDNDDDLTKFQTLIALDNINITDTIESQLRELIKSFFPKQKLNATEIEEKIALHLNGKSLAHYGVWVYYPWLQKIVHLLDKEEFIQLRTNRNQYKISPAEKAKMAQAKIGVLGLSVGQSVAMALTMERCYAELRIADFDTLDLSNLNRIRSGVQDLGLLKTVSTARQIAEIDPFLNITCFHEGVNDQNIDDFLTQNGKLDILIDECDGFNVKILSRQRAKKFGIPVIMETSDRCMLDIERFDLEPERPILHGLINHLDLDYQRLNSLTMEQKVAYIMPILGINTMSTKIKASMLEIDQSITTWPQLASDVIMGGAVTANVCRRMILGNINFSGRFFLDLDEIISSDTEYFNTQNLKEKEVSTPYTSPKLSQETQIPQLPSPSEAIEIEKIQIEKIIEAAILAPSGGNSQPWKFVYQNKNLYCLLDDSRAHSFLDFKQSGSVVAIGAALENIRLQAEQMNLLALINLLPTGDNQLIAQINFSPLHQETSYTHLHSAIKTRLTYRKNVARKLLDNSLLQEIKQAGESHRFSTVKLITDGDSLQKIGQMLGRIDFHLLTNPNGHKGFMSEIRWTDEDAKKTADGVDIATVDLSKGEIAAFSMAKDWNVIQKLIEWKGGQAFEKMAQKAIESASGMFLLTINGYSKSDFIQLGMAVQRLWLCANKLGIALQPMSPITFLFYRLLEGKGEGLTSESQTEISKIYAEFKEIFELNTHENPGFLFRIVVPDGNVVTSLRRPLADVFEYRN